MVLCSYPLLNVSHWVIDPPHLQIHLWIHLEYRPDAGRYTYPVVILWQPSWTCHYCPNECHLLNCTRTKEGVEILLYNHKRYSIFLFSFGFIILTRHSPNGFISALFHITRVLFESSRVFSVTCFSFNIFTEAPLKSNWFSLHRVCFYDFLPYTLSLVTLPTWSYSELPYWRASAVRTFFFFEDFTAKWFFSPYLKRVLPNARPNSLCGSCRNVQNLHSFLFLSWRFFLGPHIDSIHPLGSWGSRLLWSSLQMSKHLGRSRHLTFSNSACVCRSCIPKTIWFRLLTFLSFWRNTRFAQGPQCRDERFASFPFFLFSFIEDVKFVRLICFPYRIFVQRSNYFVGVLSSSGVMNCNS